MKFRAVLIMLLTSIPRLIHAEGYSQNLYMKLGIGVGSFLDGDFMKINNTNNTKFNSKFNWYLPNLYIGYNINEYWSSGVYILNSLSFGNAFYASVNLEESFNSKFVSSYMNLNLGNVLPSTDNYNGLRSLLKKEEVASVTFDFSNLLIAPFVNINLLKKKSFVITCAFYGGLNVMYGVKSAVTYDMKNLYEKLDNDTTLKNEFTNWISESQNQRDLNLKINPQNREEINLTQHFKEELLNYLSDELSITKSKDSGSEDKDKAQDQDISYRNNGNAISFKTQFKNKMSFCFGFNVGASWNFYQAWEANLLAHINFLGKLSELTIDNVDGSNFNTQKIFLNMKGKNHKIEVEPSWLKSLGVSLEIKFNF